MDAAVLAVVGALRLAGPVSIEPADVRCVADAVYHEARSEPLAAQVGVASAVLNRGSPCSVVRAPGQFSYRAKGHRKVRDAKAWNQAVEVAVLVSTGAVNRYSATHFHDVSVVPGWTRGMQYLGQSGTMKFWRAT